ncbi:MAG: ABC transporter permease [Blastocatellia bacterium]|nr:ABC transporter permease [Blastocatellia bacterium]
MNTLWQDMRYGARMLLKRFGFTLIAVATLAVGIGGNTAIFTVVDAALLRGLPYRAPERLVHLFEVTPQKEFPQREFSYPDYQDYQRNEVFEGVAAYTGGGGVLTGRGEPQRIFAPAASANFFSVLGVEPMLGRTFREGEDKPGAERVTVLTYGMWQRMFGGDSAVLGQPLTISGNVYTIVGVLPPGFQFALRPADLWLPYQPTPSQMTRRGMHGSNLIGRLRPGISREQAATSIGAIASRIEQEHAESHAGTGILLVPLQEQVTGAVRPMLLALLGAVAFVLLMVCANVASLLLARAISRQKEIAVRAALGATRGRVIRQLLTEAAMLSLLGGLGGLLVASWGLDALVAALPDVQLNAMPFLKSLRIDGAILGFAFGLSLLTGLVFGLVPALQASKQDLHEALKEGGRASGGGARQRLRGALVVTQIALAMVLLVGAGLMLKSLWRLLQVDIGFDPQNVLTMTLALPAGKYAEPERVIAFHEQLRARIEALPGVHGVGAVDRLPLLPGNTTRFLIEGEPAPPPGQEIEANFRVVDMGYFQTIGVPLFKGSLFSALDKADAPRTVIINRTLAEKMLGGRDPVGRRIVFPGFPDQTTEIVGVVGDVKITGLDQSIKPVLYVPFLRNAPTMTSLVVRTATNPDGLTDAVRNECRRLEPEALLFNVQTMQTLMNNTPAVFFRRFPALLTGIFAAIAMLLASMGIYGVVSYSVSRQIHEIGVRMALGARVSDILTMILKQGLSLALLGIAIGTAAALGLMRLLGSLLPGVSASDPATFALVAGLLLLVSLLACWIPARRATRVDPMIALRYE